MLIRFGVMSCIQGAFRGALLVHLHFMSIANPFCDLLISLVEHHSGCILGR